MAMILRLLAYTATVVMLGSVTVAWERMHIGR